MLSRTSRQEILRKIEASAGHPINEKELPQGTYKAISNLAHVQRHLLVISEILNGEEDRVEKSAVLSLASRLRKDEEMASHLKEIEALQSEIAKKVTELAQQILKEEEAKQSGNPPPERAGAVEVAQLKCPTCGAALPLPTGRFMKCEYCGSTVTIRDVSSQIRTLIKSI